ncbi:MAG: extracellular solute-binding protein [Clostridiales bacterium]|nr:extracellular solute-binding protein [Clostridiales bacterium]
MKRNFFKAAACVLAMTAALAQPACVGPSPSPSGQTEQGGTASSPPSQAPVQEPAEESYFGNDWIVNEKLTLHAVQSGAASESFDDGDNVTWFYKELEKKTNIHIVIDMIGESEWSTRLNLMFASGEYPEIILTPLTLDVEDYGVSQGLLLPLDEHITPENMPNYYERLQMNNSGESIPASDGKSYYIGKLIAQNVNHEANWFINKVWLDALNLPIPTTVDELTETLRAFRDQDPNGNGEKDEIPISFAQTLKHNQTGAYNQFSSFGIPLVDAVYATIGADGKIVFPGYMPGFRAGAEWLHLLYSEGLMDQESLTQDVLTWMTKVNELKVGMFTYLRLLNGGLSPEAVESYVSFIPPASEYGVQVPETLEVPTIGAALTISNEHVTETLKWLDAQLETRTMMIAYNGPDVPEGGPTTEDGTPVEPTIFINDDGKYEIKYVPEDNGLYDYVPVLMAQFFAPGDYYFDIYEMPPHRVERYNYSREYAEAGVMEPKSYNFLSKLVKMPNEDAIEIQRIYVEIQKMMEENLSSFITSGVSDQNWQSFLDTAQNIGVDKYLALYQKAYDAYLAK